MIKKLFLILLFSLYGAPYALASNLSVSNAGFVPSNIWYSKEPFYAGEKIRVYTIIFNGSAYDLSGKVEFFDNGTSMGKTNFSLAKGGRVQDLWIDWSAKEGSHVIAARLVNVVADGSNGKQAVVLPNSETGKSERVIEVDPAVKAAQAKAEADNATKTSSETLSKVGGVLQSVADAIPAPVKSEVSSSVGTLEAVRAEEANLFRIKKENKAKEIDTFLKTGEQKAQTPSSSKTVAGATDEMLNITEKPFAYFMFALFGALQYLFEWQVLFYGVIVYTFYRIIKWIVRKIRSRP